MTQTEAAGAGQLLTWDEVCGRLKISRTTLFELRRQGHLPAVELPPAGGTGRKPLLRWRESDIDAFIESSAPTP
jgi:excisionase family DNA binding protein